MAASTAMCNQSLNATLEHRERQRKGTSPTLSVTVGCAWLIATSSCENFPRMQVWLQPAACSEPWAVFSVVPTMVPLVIGLPIDTMQCE